MPEFRATVIGENFEFLVDDDRQCLDFSRTLYVNANDEGAAEVSALAVVREELLAQSLLDEQSDQQIFLDEIKQVDVLADREENGDFVWYFPDDLYEDDD